MRVAHFVVLPYAALAGIAIQASRASASFNPAAELRDLSEHRNSVPSNRSLMAQEGPDHEERMISSLGHVISDEAKIAKIISDHAGIRTVENDAIQVLKEVTEELSRVQKMENHYSEMPRPPDVDWGANAFAYHLEEAYSANVLARAIVSLDYGAPESKRRQAVGRMIDIVAGQWKDSGEHSLPKVVRLLDTKDDVDFFRPTVLAFLRRFASSDDDVKFAILAHFNHSISRFFSAVRQAKGVEGPQAAVGEECEDWMYNWIGTQEFVHQVDSQILRDYQSGLFHSAFKTNNFKPLTDEAIDEIVREIARRNPKGE